MISLRKIASRLPKSWQRNIRQYRFSRQIHRGTFRSGEPEFAILDEFVSPGDWVLDIGANVGHYTLKLSDLVGPQGRVFAFEPITSTVEILLANLAAKGSRNVTLVNVAVSNEPELVRMEVPCWRRDGLSNYYEAHVASESAGDADSTYVQVFGMRIDCLCLPKRVTFIKMDVEGHELQACQGMAKLLERDHPTLVIEGDRAAEYLTSIGYCAEYLPDSPNGLWRYRGNALPS